MTNIAPRPAHSPADPAPLAHVDGLTVTAGESPLVDGLGFDIYPGERLGVIGESGSGKSLTALSLLGLLPRGLTASGTAHVDGVDMISSPQRRLDSVRGATVTAVFQEPLTALDPLMPLGKQLAWPLARHHGLRGAALRTAVIDALDEVKIPSPARVAAARLHEISGGQRQRVAIAMALACSPRLLIADEPTTALDVTVQAGVLELLDTAVRERGMAMLFISHDLAVVSQITDRLLVMRGGRAVETGAVADVLTAPHEPYTRELVAAARALEEQLPLPEGTE